MIYTVTVMHNITRVDGRLAILNRITPECCQPGDTLQNIGELAVDADNPRDAADQIWEIANGYGPRDLSATYSSWNVRSLCFPGSPACCGRSCCRRGRLVWPVHGAEGGSCVPA